MAITPLAAAAVPAGVAALQLASQVRQNQPFRQLLSQLGSAPTQAPTAEADGEVDELQKFHDLVQQRLESAGISTSLRFEITSDAAGNLHVTGNHPRREQIEHALAGDPQIVAALARLSASPSQQQFAEQYVADASGSATPVTASSFSILVNGDEIEITQPSGTDL